MAAMALTPNRATGVCVLGLGALIVPTLLTLIAHETAQNGDLQSLFVIAIAAVLTAQKWVSLRIAQLQPMSAPLVSAFVTSLIGYAAGRAYDVLSLEAASLILVLWMLFYERFGWSGVRTAWFPLLFLAFIVPVPGMLLNALTAPLKIGISWLAAWTLRGFDFPIGRSGATLYVAQHQLLVEDACAGLNTLVSLIALCCFYIYAVRPAGLRGAAPLLLAVVPVALLANFMRVILLILITYYFDNEVAQGFIHQGAGLLMALVALAALMGVDVALGRVSGGPR